MLGCAEGKVLEDTEVGGHLVNVIRPCVLLIGTYGSTLPQRWGDRALPFLRVTFQRDGSQVHGKDIPGLRRIHLKETEKGFIIATFLNKML